MYHTYDNMSRKNIREVYMYIYVHIISYDYQRAYDNIIFLQSTSLLIRTLLCIHHVLCGDIKIYNIYYI